MPSTHGAEFEQNYCAAPDKYSSIKQCTDTYVNSSFGAEFNKACEGKEKCEFAYDGLVAGYKKDGKNKCSDFYARLYINYSCDFQDSISDNQKIGVFVTLVGITCCLLFGYTVYYLMKSS